MESFLTRYRNPLVLVAVLLAQVIGLATQMHRVNYASSPDGHNVRVAREWANYTLVPVEKLLAKLGGGVRSTWSGYVDLRQVRQHSKDLQYQIDQLRLQQAGMLEDARQGQRLEHLLAFKQQYVGKTVAAQVIGTGGGDRSHILVLNKGSNDGLQPDMAVITPDGIVGKLRDVFPDSSQLLLINDTSSGAGVILANVRSRGILRGTASGQVQIGTLLPDDRIKPGEPVVTSGGDRVFPRGLRVGTVQSVRLDPEHQPYTSIAVQPAANLDRLEEVLVVTDAAQQLALPQAADPAAANGDGDKRASEIVAERLPGLHDVAPAATGTDAEAAAKAAKDTAAKDKELITNPHKTLPTPKPTPVLHPDRYSPGTVPNAADLQPGQRNGPGSPQP